MSGLNGLSGVAPSGDGKNTTPRRTDAKTTHPNCVFTTRTSSTGGRELIGTDNNGRDVEFYYYDKNDALVHHATFEYDNNNRVIKTSIDETHEKEDGTFADGKIDRILYCEYDSNDEIVTLSEDLDADGTVDQVQHFEYDVQGRQIKTMRDNNNDGKIDYIEHWIYNDDGSQSVATDTNADGTIDSLKTYEVKKK